jgi:hypothetical protein
MNVTNKRTNIILQALQEKHDAEWCSSYGEPGYNNPENGIVFANWNNISSTLADYLEAAGYELEWSDEWMIDYNHGKAYRTSPNSYGWQSSIVLSGDCEWLTPDDGAFDVISELACTDPAQGARMLPPWVTEQDLTELGFIKQGKERESGLHPGQTADPEEVLIEVFKDKTALEVVFTGYPSQFHTTWQAWVKYEN